MRPPFFWLMMLVLAGCLSAQEAPCLSAEQERQARPGMWTYFWYVSSQADAFRANQQTLPCVLVNGKRELYTTVTTSRYRGGKEITDRLVAQLKPVPVPEAAYFWYSATQAEDERRRSEWKCIRLDDIWYRYTEMTIGSRPAGKAEDYQWVGKAQASEGRPCPPDSHPRP